MILRRPSYDRAYRKLSPPQQARIDAALARLESVFGQPHQHAGLGLRPIGPFFELRAGLQMRVLFVPRRGDLILVTAGDHDAIRAYIKNA